MNKGPDETFAFVFGMALGILTIGILWGFWTRAVHDPIREARAWLRQTESEAGKMTGKARDIRKRLEAVLKEKGR